MFRWSSANKRNVSRSEGAAAHSQVSRDDSEEGQLSDPDGSDIVRGLNKTSVSSSEETSHGAAAVGSHVVNGKGRPRTQKRHFASVFACFGLLLLAAFRLGLLPVPSRAVDNGPTTATIDASRNVVVSSAGGDGLRSVTTVIAGQSAQASSLQPAAGGSSGSFAEGSKSPSVEASNADGKAVGDSAANDENSGSSIGSSDKEDGEADRDNGSSEGTSTAADGAAVDAMKAQLAAEAEAETGSGTSVDPDAEGAADAPNSKGSDVASSKGKRGGRSSGFDPSCMDDLEDEAFRNQLTALGRAQNTLIWFIRTSPEASLGPLDACSVSSAIEHNPGARVLLLSNGLTCAGAKAVHPSLRVVRFKYEGVYKAFPALAAWYRSGTWKGAFDRNNLGNALRLALLYRYGGAYFDTDVLMLRGIAGDGGMASFVGVERDSVLNNAAIGF